MLLQVCQLGSVTVAREADSLGAMAALANVVTFRNTLPPNSAGIDSQTMHADQDLLYKLRYLFQTRFCLTPISSPA